MSARVFVVLAWVCVCGAWGCRRGPAAGGTAGEVVVYTSVDEPVATPILQAFEQQTGVRLRVIPDTEATKSAGLAARLLAEKANPQADVFWGNEVFHTINLARNGVLAPFDAVAAKDIPTLYRGVSHQWAGTCLRARVLSVAAGDADATSIRRLQDLAAPSLKGQVALARPTAGTSGGHVSALYAVWGTARADEFFQALYRNDAKMVGGNSVVAELVGQGQMRAGITDNDDVANVRRAGGKLDLRLPDQQPGEIGTLTIPCTVALVAGRPESPAAKQLVEYLLSDAVERRLIEAGFGQYSVRSGNGEPVKTMDVSYEAIAERMEWAPVRAAALLEGRAVPARVDAKRSDVSPAAATRSIEAQRTATAPARTIPSTTTPSHDDVSPE